jgi:hypothetical protein
MQTQLAQAVSFAKFKITELGGMTHSIGTAGTVATTGMDIFSSTHNVCVDTFLFVPQLARIIHTPTKTQNTL